MIKGSYPSDINLKILYLIYLLDSAASYFLFSYKNIILHVYQRIDIISIISTLLNLALYIIQIIILVLFRSYYAYVFCILIFTIINNVLTAQYVSKHYPQYNYMINGEKLPQNEKKEIIKNTYGMFLFGICNVTRNSFDSIFISSFIGLTAASIYGNYYCIFAGVSKIQQVIRESMSGGIGNKIALNTPEKNHEDMLIFMFLYAWLTSICTACMLCLYQPFMKIWVGEKLMLNEHTMIIFCIYFYVLSLGSIRFIYHQAAGLFWKKRYWTIAEALINIIGNYVLVRLYGISGIICATIISLLTIDFTYTTTIVYRYYFKNGKIGIYFKKHGIYSLITILGCTPAYLIVKQININGIIGILIRSITCLIVSNSIFFLCYRNLSEYPEAMKIMKRVFNTIKPK